MEPGRPPARSPSPGEMVDNCVAAGAWRRPRLFHHHHPGWQDYICDNRRLPIERHLHRGAHRLGHQDCAEADCAATRGWPERIRRFGTLAFLRVPGGGKCGPANPSMSATVSCTIRAVLARRFLALAAVSLLLAACGGSLASSNGTATPSSVGATPSRLPSSAAAHPDHWAYVTAGGNVVPIDLATNTALAPIPVLTGPIPVGPLAITPDGKTAYVTLGIGSSVLPIDLASKTRLPIVTGTGGAADTAAGGAGNVNVTSIAITPDGKTAYVAIHTGVGQSRVVPIDLATNTALAPIVVAPGYLSAIAITPDGKTAYVSVGGQLEPIDSATNTAQLPIDVPGSGSAFDITSCIAISPDGKTAYLPDVSSVIPIDLAAKTALAPIANTEANGSIVPAGFNCVAISPDGKMAYLTTNNSVVPIDLAAKTMLAPIPEAGAGSAYFIAISQDAKMAYVTTGGYPYPSGTSTVVPINLITKTALAPIVLPQAAQRGFASQSGYIVLAP